ncbi:glycosyl hydrolase family 2, sugar binding domain protein [Rhodopirellula sallentina SM41]|uniref:Glycosyl hydrolase family 2, sugar binding domain protein n=2 Tax=Rhodopirellula TaxID=265488 RepID=M5U9P5_9BACT|nr:glycosyl hydrolase family 2, sugar binding domain protein [Rhodopirellula sallentina SM41]
MVRRTSGATSRPAPQGGLGFECDKFDKAALDHHYSQYAGKLIDRVEQDSPVHGVTTIHIDSWEMGAQNWTDDFVAQFRRLRGYDPIPYLPAYAGRLVGGRDVAERFLWDVRQTSQDLILANHAEHMKMLARQDGLKLSIEPYDMNPASDLNLGAVADVPMCEFWGHGFHDTTYSCVEATSIAHVLGKTIVAAEAFTGRTQYREHPWAMKTLTDWAFCMGINRLVFHTFAHKPLGDQYRPGMTMGPYGTHWDRGQTFWPMVDSYHQYVTRCSHLLRQGTHVADILYLTPEGVPHIFRPPHTALDGSGQLADQRGYRFDACSSKMLIERAEVVGDRIAFRGDDGRLGTHYRLLVMPLAESMTPELLKRIHTLVAEGATVVGAPPERSPSLMDYPQCDDAVQRIARSLWGDSSVPDEVQVIEHGRGRIYWGGESTRRIDRPSNLANKEKQSWYSDYQATAKILEQLGVRKDFETAGPVRFIHRHTSSRDIYFIANESDENIHPSMTFRVSPSSGRVPELWDPVTCQRKPLAFEKNQDFFTIRQTFAPRQSYFVVFSQSSAASQDLPDSNLVMDRTVALIDGPWNVSFDPNAGGPESTTFESLQDWTSHDESGIRYYSGIAEYSRLFRYDQAVDPDQPIYLDLGVVHDLARVRLNDQDLGVVWCAPWRVDVSSALLKGENRLVIEVANRWRNRLLGDRQPGDADVRTVQFDTGLLGGKAMRAGRYSFTTLRGRWTFSEPEPSGLLGPVRITRDEPLDQTRLDAP